MKLSITAFYIFLLTASLNAQYNYRYDNVFPPAPNFLYGEMGGHGVAVDPAGKVWIIPYKSNPRDSVFVPDSNKYFYTSPVYVYNPDGTPCSFSPVGMVNTPEKKNKILNQGKTGITTDINGNIIVCDNDELIRINYQTGKGMNWASMSQLGSSLSSGPLCKPAVDKNNTIYVTNVLPGYPIKILNTDFTFREKSALVNDLGRTMDVSSDGSTIYAHRYTGRVTYVYKRSPSTGTYVVTDTLFRGFAIESSGFNPVNGLLYVSAGSYNDLPVTNPSNMPNLFYSKAQPGSYYGIDLSTMKIVDSLSWKFNVPKNYDERNRGIAFSPDAKAAYIVGFGGSNYPIVQRLFADPTTIGWTADIAVSDVYGYNKRLYFGLDYTATDGIDAKLGESKLNDPVIGVFDARLILPLNAGASLKDIRNTSNPSIIWTIQFQPGFGGNYFTFAWNPDKLPSDGFYLRDLSGGSVVNVDMKKQSNYTLNSADIRQLRIEYVRFSQATVNVNTGWNMVSVPIISENMSPSYLFPAATSEAFEFKNGYTPSSVMECRKGYWLRFASNSTVKLNGKADTSKAQLNEGWNLIGLTDKSIAVNSILTSPPGIITSYWFGYNSRYVIADTIKPGYGYWVKSYSSGTINLPGSTSQSGTMNQYVSMDKSGSLNTDASAMSNAAMSNTAMPNAALSKQELSFDRSGSMGKIYFTDNLGRSIPLYCASALANSGIYSLPPVPPEGVFDVRFAEGTFASSISNGSQINISSAQFPVKIKAEGVTLKLKDMADGSIIDRTLKSGEEMTISKEINSLYVSGQVMTPSEYRLFQNYPNPFNPSTVIRYSLARESQVTLKIYNILGEVVKELFNGIQPSGLNDMTFTAGGMASGVYFYKIEAKATDGSGTFTDVKKLLLLR